MCGGDAEVRKGGAREAGKEKGIVEKGVAERKGHRVIDGPHTHHDVRSEDVERNRSRFSFWQNKNVSVGVFIRLWIVTKHTNKK